MSEQVGKGSRLFWWLAATGIVVAICALVLLFRVPLALWVLRKDVLDPPTSGLVRRVVRSAGESAIPYLREGLDDPKERYAGYCGWELLRHWPKLGLEARDEFLVATNKVSLEFAREYARGSDPTGVVVWTSPLSLPPGVKVGLEVALARGEQRRSVFRHVTKGGLTARAQLALAEVFGPEAFERPDTYLLEARLLLPNGEDTELRQGPVVARAQFRIVEGAVE